MTALMLVFDMACGVPCPAIEPPRSFETIEECRRQREPTKHRYWMTEQRPVWVLCKLEPWQ